MTLKNILIIDDDVSITSIFEFMLNNEGFNPILANTKEDSLQIVKSDIDIDLIFLDIKMPNIKGLELFKEIQKIRPNVLIVMITGYSVDHLLKEAFDLGAYAVIYKPFDINEVLNLISQVFVISKDKKLNPK
ncbi:MAG: response regulator [Candidatus Margulisiibacteriota bacterium]|jgi:DNA-binding NtrC family response regulator